MKWIALLVLLVLCGCASHATLSTPQVSTQEFTVSPFPNEVFLIVWKGSNNVNNERLLDLAMLKASQVVQQHKLEYFVIVDQAASKPGEVKYRATAPSPAGWNNELLIQAFKDRPHRAFAFLAAATEQSIYEKFRTAPEPETL
ncbi:MAG TPA: hypothetical protein VK850_16650 [Candidatus Binatia bacterium]|nr:hypothetical protein [Candidatus Binatia bacterium]